MRLRHPDGLELLGIAVWGLCLLTPISAVAAPGENLVANPSFEELDSDGRGPADWQFNWKNTHSNDAERGVEKQEPGFAISEAEASHGRRSVKIEVARPQDDGVLTAQTIRIDRSVRIYRASVWIKTQGLTETTARLRFGQLRARVAKGRWTGPTETREDGDQTVSGEFKMDNGWSFADYDATRRLMADAIAELDQRP